MVGTVRHLTVWALSLAAVWLLLTGAPAHADTIEELSLQFEGGYRVDDLDWSIAGTPAGTDPNVLSELSWEDVEIYQLRASGKVRLGRADFPYFTSYLRGSLGYGWIVDGEVQDSDYAGDNRTFEFSRSVADNEGDDVWDFSIGLGLRFPAWSERLTISPVVGYSYHEQNLNMTDGFQVVSDQDVVDVIFGPDVIWPSVGPFAGLDSTYETQWSGPWVGFDFELLPSERFSLTGSVEYHWPEYEAEGVWNLRDTGLFALAQDPSFEHEADGEGLVLAVNATYDIDERWSLNLSADYRDWETDSGDDRTFFADGSVGVTQLNEVNWESYAFMLGVSYDFF